MLSLSPITPFVKVSSKWPRATSFTILDPCRGRQRYSNTWSSISQQRQVDFVVEKRKRKMSGKKASGSKYGQATPLFLPFRSTRAADRAKPFHLFLICHFTIKTSFIMGLSFLRQRLATLSDKSSQKLCISVVGDSFDRTFMVKTPWYFHDLHWNKFCEVLNDDVLIFTENFHSNFFSWCSESALSFFLGFRFFY